MVHQYVTRVHRQHSSMVTSVPLAVRERMQLTNGDHLMWQVDDSSDFVQMCKVVARGDKNHGAKGNIDKQD
jgi:hypothetical protein